MAKKNNGNKIKARTKNDNTFNFALTKISSNLFLGIFLSAVFTTTGCTLFSKSGSQNDKSAYGSRDDFGGREESPTPSKAQSESEPTPKKVALILGPGGYKAFAHAGVIKELKKKNIPINAVVGMEWGALVGALFAQRGQISEAEWKLYKLEKIDLNSGGFFSRKKDIQSVRVLDGYLKENLNVADINQTAVPFYCPSLSVLQGAMNWQDRGSLAKGVSNCLSYPPLFQNPQQMVAGLLSFDEIALRLKKEGFNVIILVNVLGDGILFDNSAIKDDYATAVLWNEVRRALWRAKSSVSDTIEVSTRGIGIGDFESRKLLVTAGEAAGEKAAQNLANKYDF